MSKKTVKLLLPALLETKEQRRISKECRESLVSKDYDIELTEDNNRYENRVAEAWNTLLDPWRGKEYDFLFIIASDTIADPNAIDWTVKCAEDNPKSGLITGRVTRDLKQFHKLSGKRKYTPRLTAGLLDPACFVLPQGVIEKVGRVDEDFPTEFVERDYIYRCKLAGYDVIQPDIVLWYHPPYAGTIGNDQKRLNHYLRKYVAKWGGDANAEKYTYPYNNMNYDYTRVRK